MVTLTHRGNIPDDTDQFVKDRLSGNIVLIDGITAGDSLESVVREFLTGLPPQLGQTPCGETEGRAARLDERFIKLEEWTGSKIGPRARLVEGLVDSAYEEDRLEILIPAQSGVIVGLLFKA